MSNPKRRGGAKYVAENRNPITRSRPDPKADAGTTATGDPAAPPDSEAPTTANPARRMRLQFSRPVLGWATLIAALVLLALLVVLWATGGLGRPGSRQVAAAPTAAPILDVTPAAEGSQVLLGEALPSAQQVAPTSAIPAVGTAPGPAPAVGAGFSDYYSAHGGLNILGAPLSDVLTVNGREIQWFERARVERWPEYAGTPYEIQLGRLGVEYTAGRQFASQQYFVSQPELRFFAETGHALGGAFLTFWEQNGGLDAFGLPISEEFDEVLPDGKAYRVQYFERARLELHPEAAGTPYEVQAGLLGTALYRNESRPETIQPVPTAVPLP
jgi:hypothetical protein